MFASFQGVFGKLTKKGEVQDENMDEVPICVGTVAFCMLHTMATVANRNGRSCRSDSSTARILMDFFDADIGKGRFRIFWAKCLQAVATLNWPDDSDASAGGSSSDLDEVLEGAVAVAVVVLPMLLLRTYAWLFTDE